ncbi:hypothetical protein KSZ_34180 [Dictyobacter formicarum]|uniref:Uncharacterized protein n=1 Tax=Dictyobacter formicarum TaxID=2778368 RepID=A0ABQ3VGW1_9CHLR|nr:hypothetical protein KSZ_34180 [Dictyobacter formicarum]
MLQQHTKRFERRRREPSGVEDTKRMLFKHAHSAIFAPDNKKGSDADAPVRKGLTQSW